MRAYAVHLGYLVGIAHANSVWHGFNPVAGIALAAVAIIAISQFVRRDALARGAR